MSRGSLDLFAGRLEHFADRVRALADRDGISAGERAALLGVAADAEALAPRANAVEYWCDSNVPEHLLGVCTPPRLCCSASVERSACEALSEPQGACSVAAGGDAEDGAIEARIAAAAKAWWEDFRPHGWSEEQHLRHPAINTAAETERALAEVVSRWIKATR